MTKPPKSASPASRDADREARLAEALRENLKRRKAQARARKARGTETPRPEQESEA